MALSDSIVKEKGPVLKASENAGDEIKRCKGGVAIQLSLSMILSPNMP